MHNLALAGKFSLYIKACLTELHSDYLKAFLFVGTKLPPPKLSTQKYTKNTTILRRKDKTTVKIKQKNMYSIINRPGVPGAVLQTPLSLID